MTEIVSSSVFFDTVVISQLEDKMVRFRPKADHCFAPRASIGTIARSVTTLVEFLVSENVHSQNVYEEADSFFLDGHDS